MSNQDVQVQITPRETFINFVTTAIHRVTGLIAGSSASMSQMDYACTQLEQLSSVIPNISPDTSNQSLLRELVNIQDFLQVFQGSGIGKMEDN